LGFLEWKMKRIENERERKEGNKKRVEKKEGGR
jgi:hypothetical protein